MQATDSLMRDHRVIEQVLQVLETIGEQGEATKLLDASAARAALDFCRTFADGVHHAKEEAHLFPMLEANGFGGGCGPVAILRREHELGRLYVQGMAAAVEAAAAGDPDALQGFAQHARRYVTLLREHIHKEDTCLFPAAGHRLPEPEQQRLRAAFEQAEATAAGAGTDAPYVTVAQHLADRVGATRPR
jgi:hemerythrin-like domain-containing protein